MIEPFEYYEKENLVRKGSPDKQEALSLMRKALDRMEYVKEQIMSDKTASFVFEDIYESIREASQALMELIGYKPYSHEAVIAFLRDFHKINESEFNSFNRYRILRNKCIYRGARVTEDTCKEAFEFMVIFIPKLKKIFTEVSKVSL